MRHVDGPSLQLRVYMHWFPKLALLSCVAVLHRRRTRGGDVVDRAFLLFLPAPANMVVYGGDVVVGFISSCEFLVFLRHAGEDARLAQERLAVPGLALEIRGSRAGGEAC